MHETRVELKRIFGPPNINGLYNALLIPIKIYAI